MSRTDDGPRLLYKYRSLKNAENALERERTYDIIENSRLWFASPPSFNDPFEAQFVIRFDANREERIAYWMNSLELRGRDRERARDEALRFDLKFQSLDAAEVETKMRAQLEEHAAKAATVLSLAETPEDVLMWSHHASSHTGICLGFERSVDLPFFAAALPVNYQARFPEFNFFRSTDSEKVGQALLTKSDRWKHESEWRIVRTDEPPQLKAFHPALLKTVTLGARVSDADRQDICSRVRGRCEVFQAQLDPSRFSLRLERV